VRGSALLAFRFSGAQREVNMRQRTRSSLIYATVISTLAFVFLAGATTAMADKPVRTFLPYGGLPPEGITISDICEFPVALVPKDIGHEYQMDFSDGRTIITGRTQGSLVNVDTGKSIFLNSPVAIHITAHPDGSQTIRLAGTVLVWFFEGELGPGSEAFIRIYRGQEIITVDASGGQTFTQKAGTNTDVCALLG
jgi:hypothetical protein